MDIHNQDIKRMIEQKIVKELESDDEIIKQEHKITGEGTTINISHNCSICLLMYLYLMDKNDVPTKELKGLEEQIIKLEKKNQDFNEKLMNIVDDLP